MNVTIAARRRHHARRPRRYMPLLERVAGMNALLVAAAVLLTIVVLAPHRLSSLRINEEVAVLVGALALVTLVNFYLLRRVIRPVQALTALARRVDLTRPGERMPDARPTSEAGELALTFNQMLDRLEAERREATGRVLAGQEAERVRIARELHDQVGQQLTAVLLVLSRLQIRVPESLRADVVEIQDEVRASLEDVRKIAIELRPEALDDLGLVSALTVLSQRFSERSGLEVSELIDPELPRLTREVELAVYRVAQEALTNVVRHSHSRQAQLRLAVENRRLVLTVSDRGSGLAPATAPGTGTRGMRERAGLIGASLEIKNNTPAAGCTVRLAVPLDGAR
jgi:two-component system, NarL family, sensor histidine kinase UhpB